MVIKKGRRNASLVCLEYSWLRQLKFNAIASLVVIFFVQFKADEVALLFYTSNGGGAAAHEGIEYSISLQT